MKVVVKVVVTVLLRAHRWWRLSHGDAANTTGGRWVLIAEPFCFVLTVFPGKDPRPSAAVQFDRRLR